ncbi:MAG: aminoglycoside phosphotransferase family protein [Chloroflexota bacterium]|nr:aminoglycoside phosphotransferase family protein [Chloroflexota bacterium]
MIPVTLIQTIQEVWGQEGAAWLEAFPDLLADLTHRWSIEVGPPFPDLSYNYVAPAVRADGTPAVLKLGVPCSDIAGGAEALRLYGGRGMARLIEEDLSAAAMLQERLLPGTALSENLDIEEADAIAAEVLRKLWRPVPSRHSLVTVKDWAESFERYRALYGKDAGPLPASLVDEARQVYNHLAASSAESVLLHGDFHQGNVLAAQREPWLAIDPKGLIGEPAYDAATLLRDRSDEILAGPRPVRAMIRRLDRLAAELDLDRERLRAWAFSQAVLSAIWSLEDHGYGWEDAIAAAELLRDIST